MAQLRIVRNSLSQEIVEKMLHHFETYNFIKILDTKTIKHSFMSEILKEFIRREWLFTNVLSSDQPAFLSDSLKTEEKLKIMFEDTKNLVGTLPFSLVEINSVGDENSQEPPIESAHGVEIVKNHFKKQNGTILRSLSFSPPVNAMEDFYKKQRERKIWWRKFSALPGRFIYSNVRSNENDKSATCEILAEFPWGSENVETIKYLPDFCSSYFFEARVGKRKKCTPHVIMCETLLEKITFTYLCDSYERLSGEKDKCILKFNKKLAPFKVSIAGNGSSSEEMKNLEELSLLLAKQIRKLGLSVLLLPDACLTSIERQVLRNDAIGVPFTILLNDKTLKDGTLSLRSRDTTLQEHSHVSLIVDYLEKIMK